jgi:PAS domain-containing protein
MEIDWIITGAKTGILALSGVMINHYRKPFYVWVKGHIGLNEECKKIKLRLDKIEAEIYIIRSEQMADIHTSMQPTFKVNTKGELEYVNPAWVNLMEYNDPENAYGLRFMDVIHPEDYERVKAIHRDTVDHPSGFNDTIKFRTKKTKRTVNTICVCELIHDKDNALVAIIGRLHVVDNTT